MAHLIDKDALVAEIKKRIQESLDAGGATRGVYLSERMKEDSYILSFLDTLEVKEVDFEVEIYRYIGEHFNVYDDGNQTLQTKDKKSLIGRYDAEKIAKHFFELGLNMKQDSLTPDDIASIHSIVNDLIVASRIQFTEWDGKNIFDEALKIFKEQKKEK